MKENIENKSLVRDWYAQSFQPWQAEMARYKAEEHNQIVALRDKKHEIQFLVGLVLSAQYDRAVKGWNALGLQPRLADVQLDEAADALVFVTIAGKVLRVNVGDLIGEMQGLV